MKESSLLLPILSRIRIMSPFRQDFRTTFTRMCCFEGTSVSWQNVVHLRTGSCCWHRWKFLLASKTSRSPDASGFLVGEVVEVFDEVVKLAGMLCVTKEQSMGDVLYELRVFVSIVHSSRKRPVECSRNNWQHLSWRYLVSLRPKKIERGWNYPRRYGYHWCSSDLSESTIPTWSINNSFSRTIIFTSEIQLKKTSENILNRQSNLLKRHWQQEGKCLFIGTNAFSIWRICSMGGKSRSASVLLAYLMRKHNHSYESALDHARKVRPIVSPNPGFEKQLRQFQSWDYYFWIRIIVLNKK